MFQTKYIEVSFGGFLSALYETKHDYYSSFSSFFFQSTNQNSSTQALQKIKILKKNEPTPGQRTEPF